MKTIYIDSDFMCHLEDGEGRTAVETDAFDSTADGAIPYYRYIPKGEKWIDPNGKEYYGLFIQATNSKGIDMAMHTEFAKQLNENISLATSYLDDDEAETVTVLFEEWQSGVAYVVGDRRQYDGLLYRCVQAHISQEDWTPPQVPALWVRTWTDEWPEWVQPTGAHDTYNKGDKCSYQGKHWICTANGNIYPPDVYGWSEVE